MCFWNFFPHSGCVFWPGISFIFVSKKFFHISWLFGSPFSLVILSWLNSLCWEESETVSCPMWKQWFKLLEITTLTGMACMHVKYYRTICDNKVNRLNNGRDLTFFILVFGELGIVFCMSYIGIQENVEMSLTGIFLFFLTWPNC